MFLLPFAAAMFLSLSDASPNIFFLDVRGLSDHAFFSNMVQTMSSSIVVNTSTAEIIAVNFFVASLLWGVILSLAAVYRMQSMTALQGRLVPLSLFVYGFFFLKEGVRVSALVWDFAASASIPFLSLLFTLILPHGIPEFTAFIFLAVFVLRRVEKAAAHGRGLPFLSSKEVLMVGSLIVVAAIIETTITPWMFREFLLQSLSRAGF